MRVEDLLHEKGLRCTKNNVGVLNYLWSNPKCRFRDAINELELRDSSFYDVIRRFNNVGIRY